MAAGYRFKDNFGTGSQPFSTISNHAPTDVVSCGAIASCFWHQLQEVHARESTMPAVLGLSRFGQIFHGLERSLRNACLGRLSATDRESRSCIGTHGMYCAIRPTAVLLFVQSARGVYCMRIFTSGHPQLQCPICPTLLHPCLEFSHLHAMAERSSGRQC